MDPLPTAIPSLRSSPRMRSVPQSRFSSERRRIRARTSCGTRGRPVGRRERHHQKSRHPCRCQRSTVSGRTSTRWRRQSAHRRRATTQNTRSRHRTAGEGERAARRRAAAGGAGSPARAPGGHGARRAERRRGATPSPTRRHDRAWRRLPPGRSSRALQFWKPARDDGRRWQSAGAPGYNFNTGGPSLARRPVGSSPMRLCQIQQVNLAPRRAGQPGPADVRLGLSLSPDRSVAHFRCVLARGFRL